MYSETFNVDAKLEEPAKWLRWAIQEGVKGNILNEQYNLQQFWKSLTSAKTAAKTPKDWGDILSLDALSQEALGNHLRRVVDGLKSALAKSEGGRGVGKGVGTGAGAVAGGVAAAGILAITGVGIPASIAIIAGLVGAGSVGGNITGGAMVTANADKLKEAIARLGTQAAQAYDLSWQLAGKAEDSYKQAGYKGPQQASATKENAARGKQIAQAAKQDDQAQIQKSDDAAGKSLFSSLPGWAWGGLAATALILFWPKQSPASVVVAQAAPPKDRDEEGE